MRSFARLLIVSILCCVWGSVSWAQTATLSGVALDTNGNPVAGATVTVCPANTSSIPCNNPLQTTLSASSGAWIVYINSGTYTVTINRGGLISTTQQLTTGALPTQSIPNGVTTPSLNGVIFVDGVTYITIQAAITAAGTTKAVVIPPAYAGADAYTNPNNIMILDWRKWGLNPTTVPSFHIANTAQTAQQGGFPVENPLFVRILENDSNSFYSNPQIYLSRVDATPYVTPGGSPGMTSCFNVGPLSACESPIVLVTGTNQQTTNIPAMVGLEVNLWGFKPNGVSPPIQANFEVGLGVNVADTATDNLANLRGTNIIVNCFGNPTHTGPGGFTRTCDGSEYDTNNSSGNDAVFSLGNGTGNFMLGESFVSFGANSSSEAVGINSSNSIANKGWLDGLEIGGIVNCGLCLYKGGTGSFSPVTGIHVSEGGTNGIVIGSGTVDENKSGANSPGNPTNGLVLDSFGTPGMSETQNSETLVFNIKNASATATPLTMQGQSNGVIVAPHLGTTTNCAAVGTSASPSVASCTAAAGGSVSCAVTQTVCQVNTTAVTANSEIFISQREDTTTGTRLSVTCNTTPSVVIASENITGVVAGTSFTFAQTAPAGGVNPNCWSYWIVN